MMGHWRRPIQPPLWLSWWLWSSSCAARHVLLLIMCTTMTTITTLAYHAHPRNCHGRIRHVHLAVGGTNAATAMTVSFASLDGRLLPPLAGVIVGTHPAAMTDLYMAADDDIQHTHYRLPAAQNDGGGTYYSPHYHHVTLDGLVANTTYYYQPIIHASASAFDGYNLKSSSFAKELAELEEDYEDSSVVDDNSNWRRRALQRMVDWNWISANASEVELAHVFGRNQRGLIRWGPYDGSQRPCPADQTIRSFRTAPAAGDRQQPLVFAILGDLGQFPHSEETMARLERSRDSMHAAVLAGDIAYPGDSHLQWDTFFDFLDDYPLVDHVGLQVVPGNHDIHQRPGGDDIFVAYEHRFRMPQAQPARLGTYTGQAGRNHEGHLSMDQPPYPLDYEFGNAYYAFTFGMTRFIMMSSYSSMEPNSTQYQWLVSELDAVDRDVTPWLIVVMHVPMYNTFALHLKDPQIVAAKTHLEPLFVQHHVNLVFSGHIHAYQRTTNVVLDQPHRRGPMYITVGAGGRKCDAPFLHATPEPWVAVRDATFYGHGMLRLANATHAEWEWIHTSLNDDGRDWNVVAKDDTHAHLAGGPSQDRIWIVNQNSLP